MKPRHHGPAIAGAIAGGVIAGVVLATRKSSAPAEAARPPAAGDGVLALPAAMDTLKAEIIDVTVTEPSRARRWILLICALLVAALLAAATAAARPRITAAVAPATTIAGYGASIAYHIEGLARADATFSSNGVERTVPLSASAGTLPLPPDFTRDGREVSIVLRARGALGADARVLHVRVLARPKPLTRIVAPATPVIRRFALSASSAKGGATILAAYDSNGDGLLRVSDRTGAVWFTRPVRGRGMVALTAPLMHADTPFIVSLETRRNNQTAAASAAFISLAHATEAPVHTRPFSKLTRLIAGQYVSIALPRAASDPAFTVTDSGGTRIPVQTIAQAGAIRVRIGSSARAASLFAALTFGEGKERQTFVRRIAVTP